MNEQGKMNVANNAAALLSEHFDSVLILVTYHHSAEGITYGSTIKRGNTFAIDGQVQAFLKEEGNNEFEGLFAAEDNNEEDL